jgi:hypothetical protein
VLSKRRAAATGANTFRIRLSWFVYIIFGFAYAFTLQEVFYEAKDANVRVSGSWTLVIAHQQGVPWVM